MWISLAVRYAEQASEVVEQMIRLLRKGMDLDQTKKIKRSVAND